MLVWAVFTIALWFLNQVMCLIQTDMQYYIIYWLSGEIYFFFDVILTVHRR